MYGVLFRKDMVLMYDIVLFPVVWYQCMVLYYFQGQGILPGSQAIERYLLEEHITRIISTHHFERKDW